MPSSPSRAVALWGPLLLVFGCGDEPVRVPPPPLAPQGEARIELVRTAGFGRVAAGETTTARYEIRSTGTLPLALLGTPPVLLKPPGPFAVVSQPAATPLQPGEAVGFEIAFSPGEDGTFKSGLRVPNDSVDEPDLRLAFSATASSVPIPEIDVRRCDEQATAGRLDFGTLLDSYPGRACLAVRNDGDAPLRLASPALTGDPAFTLHAEALPLELAPGVEGRLEVGFAADRPGAFDGTLHLESDDPDEGALELEVRGVAAIDDAWALYFLLQAPAAERDAKISEYGPRASAANEAYVGLGVLLAQRHTFGRAEADAFAAETAFGSLAEPAHSSPLALAYRGMTYSFISGIKRSDGGMRYADDAVAVLAEAVAKAPDNWFVRFNRGVTLVNMGDGILDDFWASLVYADEAREWKQTGLEDLRLVEQEHARNRVELFDKDTWDRRLAPVPDAILVEVSAMLGR